MELVRSSMVNLMTLNLRSRIMGSAQRLTERSIYVKFNENRSKGSGDIEQTRNSRVNPMTLNCDHDLEPGQLSHWFCTPSH